MCNKLTSISPLAATVLTYSGDVLPWKQWAGLWEHHRTCGNLSFSQPLRCAVNMNLWKRHRWIQSKGVAQVAFPTWHNFVSSVQSATSHAKLLLQLKTNRQCVSALIQVWQSPLCSRGNVKVSQLGSELITYHLQTQRRHQTEENCLRKEEQQLQVTNTD